MKNHVLFLCCLFITSCAQFTYKGEGETKVALSRFFISGGQSYENHLKKIESELKYAKEAGAKTILFAELNTLDLFSKNPQNVAKEILNLTKLRNQYENDLKMLALKYKINIIGASTYIRIKDQLINRAYIVSDMGELSYQDKNYPTPWERKYKISQRKGIKLFKTNDFSFVVLICHDSEFPQLSGQLKNIKPEVIFVPSQTDSAYGRERVRATSRARAIENMSYVLLNGGSGDHSQPWHAYTGGASFFWPQNKYFKDKGVAHFEDSGRPVIIKLDLKKLRKARADKSQVYPQRDAIL
jgi:predicted amidohydrolase